MAYVLSTTHDLCRQSCSCCVACDLRWNKRVVKRLCAMLYVQYKCLWLFSVRQVMCNMSSCIWKCAPLKFLSVRQCSTLPSRRKKACFFNFRWGSSFICFHCMTPFSCTISQCQIMSLSFGVLFSWTVVNCFGYIPLGIVAGLSHW